MAGRRFLADPINSCNNKSKSAIGERRSVHPIHASILHSLGEMGGSATASEVTDAVIERENLDEELFELTNKNGLSKVRNQIV